MAQPGQSRQMGCFLEDQVFEEDLRAILRMMRPHREERLLGWEEYRTGHGHFRVTVAWDSDFDPTPAEQPLVVPNMAEVLESILIGSAKQIDELDTAGEFALYRNVIRQLWRRLKEIEACYE